MNRNRMVAGALGLVVGAGAIGWFAGQLIVSPAEAAARAEAPEASLITAAVESRVLSADVIARGAIDYQDPVSLSLSGTIGEEGQAAIVTMVPETGTELPEGAVALEVSGRPVFLLQGDLPVYRDLRPGSSGDDVLQLEQALQRLGFLASADKTWSSETGAAIQAMYAARGYAANTTSKTDQAALDAARDSVRAAQQALQDATKALSEAGGASGSELLAAQVAVANAQDALTTAQAQRTSAIGAAQGVITVAQQAIADADSSGTPANGTAEYTALETALVDAQNSLLLTTTEQNALVSSASRSLDLARAQLQEAQTPGDTTSLRRAQEDAKRQVADANQVLVDLEAKVGTWIPSGELIFLRNMPVQVAEVTIQRGGTVSGSFMRVSGTAIEMTVGVSKADAARLEVGDEVIIDEPELITEPITASIAEIPDSDSSDRIQMKVAFDNLPVELLGANVRVIIPVESTAGEVLVVPAAALSAVANGDTRVEVEDPDNPGTTRFVTVTTGLAADGVVEVKPVDGDLKAGDRVVVGTADIGPAGEDDPSAEPEASDSAEETDS